MTRPLEGERQARAPGLSCGTGDAKAVPGLSRPVALALVLLFGIAAAPSAAAQAIIEFPLPAGSSPAGITAGPDGNVWFVEEHGDRVGRIATSGAIAEFSLGNPRSFARGITAGPDGALWFTELPGRIGRVTPSGAVTELTIPVRPSEPVEIATGSDGNLWFTDFYERIGRLTPAGVLTFFVLPPATGPRGITAGPDGALWFAETNAGRIGRITTGGALSHFSLPDPSGNPFGITVGRDGNLWFTQVGNSRIGRMSPAGVVTEFPLSAGAAPYGITSASDGNIWFTESGIDSVGRITPAGVLSEFPIPTAGGFPLEITSGADGNLWFTEFAGDKIGRVALEGFCVPNSSTLCLNRARFQVQVVWDVSPQGMAGEGRAIPLTGDSGAFWFFSANNIEIVVKVVDGRTFNGKFWVFIGSLTDVDYRVTIRDLQTDHVNTYVHMGGTLQSFSDTAAF